MAYKTTTESYIDWSASLFLGAGPLWGLFGAKTKHYKMARYLMAAAF
jgi:hypothetical protein